MTQEQSRLIDLLDDMSSGKDVFFRSIRFVKDVMTEDVKTLTLDDTIEKSLKFMRHNSVRHIPIVDSPTGEDEKQYLVGIVSQRDVFRQISPYLGKIGELNSDLRALKQPLVQIVTRNPKSVSPKTPIADAITIMIDNGIDMLPVLAGQNLAGIITTADILKLFVRLNTICQLCRKMGEKKQKKRFIDLLSGNSDMAIDRLATVLQTVEDIMAENAVSLEGQDTIADAMEVMQEGKLRHVPIVDKQNRLMGIVSDRDILQHLPFHSRQFQPESKVFRDKLFEVTPDDPATRQTLNHIMKTDVIHVLPDCDFYTAVNMLYEMKISCLPVIDEEKKLLGIVTTKDVMRGLLAAYVLFDKSTA